MIASHRILELAASVVLVMSLAGCTDTRSEARDATQTDAWTSDFHVDRSDLISTGTNPFFVLEPGFHASFEGKEGKKKVHLTITVLDQTETVDGVETRVVEERESANGELAEVSRNYFAISKRTHDVFYFGEDVDIYEHGAVVEHEGAWRSGVNGAKFGLMMPGAPAVGQKSHQEFAPSVAMDRFEVTSMDKVIETPAGRFEHCLEVEETTPLEPGSREHKYYSRGIGLVRDGELSLVEHGR